MYKPSERSWHRLLIGSALLTLALTGWAADSGTSAPHPALGAKKTAPQAAATKPLVDINSATSAQLKTLPGITDAEAAKIVAGRPYVSKADLVGTKAIPAGRYLAIKRLIVAKQRGKPNGKP
jgi:DNA uptake protein ComE-like DNA-binding protein